MDLILIGKIFNEIRKLSNQTNGGKCMYNTGNGCLVVTVLSACLKGW